MIDLNPKIFNRKFQIYYKTKKLQDLTLLMSKIRYISKEFSFNESIDYLQGESFFIEDNNLEYYLGGGTNIDNPQIRIFSLNDPSPWRDSDLGIVPNMKWAKEYCEFY